MGKPRYAEVPCSSRRLALSSFDELACKIVLRPPTRGQPAFSMNHKFETPFDNIESAQEYLALLSQALDEAKQTAETDIGREANSPIPRRRDALRLVLYKLEKLEQHIKTSRRLLNDLRTLRRLLLEERAEPAISRQGVDSKS